MKQVLIKQGRAVVEDVPAPLPEPGTVLVRVNYSCISTGTEMSGLTVSGLPLWKRALKQPEKVKKGLQMLATQGFARTLSQVEGKLAAGQSTGYSAAGTVLETGAGIEDLRPGDRVACAGAQCAHHAEIIRVPRNLLVPVPGRLNLSAASTVTLGAIALQGVRRARPTLGETFVVIGLGILGQLTAQLLKVNGCRVIGTDLNRERITLAQKLGLDTGIHQEDGGDLEQVARLTDGIGVDGVIITASTPSDTVVSIAFQMCRKKGRVVLVGDVGLHLNRADFYQKELDFFISSSYGPGRYDRNYEERGLDYPVAYVRWTENRNMAEYLRLLDEGRVKIEPLVDAIYPVDEAPAAYTRVKEGVNAPPIVLLAYPQPPESTAPARSVVNPAARPAGPGRIRIALVGAGSFARGVHLPNLQALADHFYLQAVVSRTGHNATAAAGQFGAGYATTDFREVLADPDVDAVLITTRHNLHASMTLAALRAGKHVLVEKPLALTWGELDGIVTFYAAAREEGSAPLLLTGFNRRFSRLARHIYELVQGRSNPMVLNYRMNAGYIPLDQWVHNEEGGGRNRGEACHIYDLFTYFTGSKVVDVTARAIRPATGYYSPGDNFVASMVFADGSLATLTYTALGCGELAKERLEVYVDGKVAVLDDYRQLHIYGLDRNIDYSATADKGQRDELAAFAQAVQHGGQWPIPLWQQVQATEISLAVEELILPG